MKNQNSYQQFHEISRNAALLEGVSGHLGWDQETYMPPGHAPVRAEQLKLLAGLIHQERTSKKYETALSKLINLKTGKIAAKNLTPEQVRAAELWRRDYLKDKALPSKFVEDFAKLKSQGMEAWRHAREENSFSHFAPFLDKILVMNHRLADYYGYQDTPYDALLDLYEPEMTTKLVGKVFKELRGATVDLLKKIQSKKQVNDKFLHGDFPEDKQIHFVKQLLIDLGYPSEYGRLDISTHPFSHSTHPTDVRITTRVNPKFIMSNISGSLHEVGHGLYELGLPPEHFGSPLAQPNSLGIHESQSRWWETRIGHSKAYWEHYLPKLKKAFPGTMDKVSLDAFYKAINKVEPSFIRVEADEVTYGLHVILRFEIEKELFEGTLKVRDIPEAWNAKMKELLGIIPKSNTVGCLQDIHWSMGAMGYFPTYSLGNMFASHLFQGFDKKHPDWQKRIAKGEFTFMREWLQTNIHRHGRRYSSLELLKKATGKEFSAKAFINYLNNKYSEIYDL